MNFIIQLRQLLQELDSDTFNKGIAAAGLCFFGLTIGIVYYFYSSIGELQKNIKANNAKREDVQGILKRLQVVRSQKEEVNALLAEEKGFLITHFTSDALDSLHLKEFLKGNKDPEFSEEDVYNKKYKESKVVIQLVGITIEPLCKLLQLIEEKKRVYIKDLNITKKTKNSTMDLSLTVATLRQSNG
ncbi:hypothetical protein EBU24_03475 [bacterium]|nr:hypothetical protein [bacterium]